MAAEMGISHTSVQRIWNEHGLKPHLARTFKVSNDPDFVVNHSFRDSSRARRPRAAGRIRPELWTAAPTPGRAVAIGVLAKPTA
jgi:hypothetical protein